MLLVVLGSSSADMDIHPMLDATAVTAATAATDAKNFEVRLRLRLSCRWQALLRTSPQKYIELILLVLVVSFYALDRCIYIPPLLLEVSTPHSNMSAPCRSLVRGCCARASHHASSTSTLLRISTASIASTSRRSQSITAPRRRYQSTDAASSTANPKISTIVDQISQLTLLETADLVSTLKVCKF